MDDNIKSLANKINRRTFLNNSLAGLGAAALSTMSNPLSGMTNGLQGQPLLKGLLPHFNPRIKRVIYLLQSGAPSQLELFDHKPKLKEMFGQELPASIRGEQRITGMTADQRSFPLAASKFTWNQYGESGTWLSDLLPHHQKIVDKICMIKTMHTEAINHDPAVTFIQTGSQQSGRPSMGSWVSYGLGSENENLPSFVVLISKGQNGGQPLYAKLWHNGFLPADHQGVMFRSGHDPVLYLNNPEGMERGDRKKMVGYLNQIHAEQYNQLNDEAIKSRIAQYEMAFKMQMSVPETLDVSDEPDHVYDLYGEAARQPGTFAHNCLLARKLAEKGVRFIQLYHMGWDMHGGLPSLMQQLTKQTDQPSAGLLLDLEQRGMLDDTLIIWGGEFGRGCYSQGTLTPDNFGRDHHPRCFSIWMAGGGIKKGITIGETDDFGYNIIKDPVHVHDLQATIMHLLGVDHERFTFKYQGRRFRLTDVHGKVVKSILS